MTHKTFDAIDLEIMRVTQSGLPLVAKPYHHIAQQLGLEGDEVMQRMQGMQQEGMIRRIAAIPNHYKIGYRFNGMSVWDVDDAAIDLCGQQVGQLSFVSHCYHRPRHLPEWPYNLFAMVHGKCEHEVQQHVAQIAQCIAAHYKRYDILYSTAILKKTGFRSL